MGRPRIMLTVGMLCETAESLMARLAAVDARVGCNVRLVDGVLWLLQ